MKLPWRRGKDMHVHVDATLKREERKNQILAQRLRSLKLELGLIETTRDSRREG